MQYTHVTVDLLLMAVDQKDRKHWKSQQSKYPEAYCPIAHLLMQYDAI